MPYLSQHMRYRVPNHSISFEVINVSESRAVVNMDPSDAREAEALQELRSKTNKLRVVLVLLHSDSDHYTLMRRVVTDGVPVYTFWDSLEPASGRSREMASQFMAKLEWHGPVPPPSQPEEANTGLGVWSLLSAVPGRGAA